MKQFCGIAVLALAFAAGHGTAHATDENAIRSFLSVDRTFRCDLNDLGAFHEGYDVSPIGNLTLGLGGPGLIGVLHLETGDAKAEYRFGSKIDIENGEAMIESNLGSPTRTSGQLEADTQWPFLSVDMVLLPSNPARLKGQLRNTDSTTVNLDSTTNAY